jgi:hypothetical protein
VVLALSVAAPFCLRDGVPGLRHDWSWPVNVDGFRFWFVAGFSSWNPSGFGMPSAAPVVNVIALLWWGLAAIVRSPQLVLLVFLCACFVLGQLGMIRLFRELDIEPDPVTSWLLGASYAYSPVLFQKLVAGHLYYIAAYALLPWFTYYGWRACRGRGPVDATILAGLILAVSSTQIQFLFFDALILAIIAVTLPQRRRNALVFLAVLCFGVLYNVVALVNFPAGEGGGIAARHATRQWEVNLSASLSELFALGGYLHYDLAALPAALRPLYTLATYVFAVTALAAVVLTMALKDRARVVLVFTAIAAVGILVAAGWYGPLQIPLQYAMYHYASFAIFRELFHFMVLYVFAICVLAAYTLAHVRRSVRFAAAVLIGCVALPFISMGMRRMVPSVAASIFLPHGCSSSNLLGYLPNQEPVGYADEPQFSGLDPARWQPRNGFASGAPPVVQGTLYDISRNPQHTEQLGALGFHCVLWRAGVVSRLSTTFEPHVGARFDRFGVEQRALQRIFSRPRTFSKDSRSVLSLESPARVDQLDTILRDAQLPPGQTLQFQSSLSGNDIRTGWVAGSAWSWFLPQFDDVLHEPLFTLSRAPLTLTLPKKHGSALYILATDTAQTIDGRPGRVLDARAPSSYHWCMWQIDAARTLQLRVRPPAAVALAMVSDVASWSPRAYRDASPIGASEVPVVQDVPWTASAVLPVFDKPLRLIYARTFSRDWTLSAGGNEIGASARAHGLFNGWIIDPKYSGQRITLSYEPQRMSMSLNLLAAFLQAAALLGALVWRARKRREAACASP